MNTSHTTEEQPQSFESQAERVLGRLRDSFAQIVDSVSLSAAQPGELHKVLGIDKTLGWKILKIAHGDDVFMAAQHVPGPAAIRTFLRAAADRSTPTALVESATRALADFEDLVDRHAGDRVSLGTMAASFAKRGRVAVDLPHRKAAVRANAHIWGVHAATQFKADFVLPGTERGRIDIASLRGFVGLRRMRPNVTWVVSRARCADDDGQVRTPFVLTPIDAPEGAGIEKPPVPLLRQFCSQPLPRFRRVASADGFLEDELVEGPVGNTGAVTCITAEVGHNVATSYREEHNSFGNHIVRLRTPCDKLLFDVLVHEDVFRDLEPTVVLHSELAGGPQFPGGHARNALPIVETVELIGRGPSVVHSREVPRYGEMVRYVISKLGCDGNRLNVYRVRVAFPAIPTSLAIRYELPERPA
ncbi:MAG: hypothetical protein PVJ57_08565 [Phycisphaerae bacterium]|jgi:hypothetical protein